MERVPQVDLTHEIQSLWDELNEAIQRVLRSGQFIMGPEVEAFEGAVCDYLGVKHAISLNSGTDGLVLGLRALGVGPGDEVITTGFSFFATAEAISILGATPVFVDIDPKTYNIDTNLIEQHITPKTKVILPVHLFGQPANMAAIMALKEKYNLPILEDAAQAFGAMYDGAKSGTIGAVGVFSFFPSKNLGAYGDAGLLVTNDNEIANKAKMLRAHGGKDKYRNELVGYNSRMDAIQAAILSVKLPHIDEYNEKRRDAAHRYDDLFDGLPNIVTPEEIHPADHIYHQYTIRITNGQRDAVHEHLSNVGISSMIYYRFPIPRLPVYSGIDVVLPQCEATANEVLSLPIWPQISQETQEHIVEEIRKVL